jgi:acyl-CoA thioesterase-2
LHCAIISTALGKESSGSSVRFRANRATSTVFAVSAENDLEFGTLLALRAVERDVWTVPNPTVARPTVFGGQVAAQAVLASSRTVEPDRDIHSMHAYFLRSGQPGKPTTVAVERVRDGRSFSTRQVVARQDDVAIFSAALSFHRAEPSVKLTRRIPSVPPPDSCSELNSGQSSEVAVALREVPNRSEESSIGMLRVWVRARESLPDDPALHNAALVFMSDLRTGTSIGVELGGMSRFGMVASLDHAFWLHRLTRADAWLLMSVETLAYTHARGLVLGTFHSQDGAPVATFTQELVLRPREIAGEDAK